MVRFAAAMIFSLAISNCALGDPPSASGGRVHASSAPVQYRVSDVECPSEEQYCPKRFSFSIFENQANKLAEMRSRASQLSQHIPYQSPMEDSYFFRPYQITEVTKQQRSGRNPKNPYDNRFLQSIYKRSDLESGN